MPNKLGKKFQGRIQVFLLGSVQPEHPVEANNFHPSTSLHIFFPQYMWTRSLILLIKFNHLLCKLLNAELSLFRFNLTDKAPRLKGNMKKQVLFLSKEIKVEYDNSGPFRGNCFSFTAASWLSTWSVRYIGGIHTPPPLLPPWIRH